MSFSTARVSAQIVGSETALENLQHGIEISGAGDREARFDHVHAEIFEQFGDLDLFGGVQLTAGDLLTIAERGVENVQSLTHN